jgi:hypothetical protein
MPGPSPATSVRLDLERALAGLPDVERRLAAVPWTEVRRLDQQMRGRRQSSPDWFPDWSRMAPGHVWVLAARSGQPFAVGALLSMHGSGYVRQAAVEQLAALDDPRAFPFLLVRTTDWVPEVQGPASSAASMAFERLSDAHRLCALPLLRHLTEVHAHAQEPTTASTLLARFRRRLSIAAQVTALGHAEVQVRRAVAGELVQGAHAQVALEAALDQSDPVVARTIGVAALDQADGSHDVLRQLWSCGVPDLRALALARGIGSATQRRSPVRAWRCSTRRRWSGDWRR